MSERWKFCPHALERMRQRGFEREEVLAAVVHPEIDYPGGDSQPPNRRIAIAGRVAVVYVPPPEKRIITVLFHRELGDQSLSA